MNYKSFKKLCEWVKKVEKDCDEFNKGMEKVLGSDTISMFLKPLERANELFVSLIASEFNESKEGAEWLAYEGLKQIEVGGTEIKDGDKDWIITDLRGMYDYLKSLG